MCAGGVIHSIGDSQDIRFIGGLSVYIPFTSSSLMVSTLPLTLILVRCDQLVRAPHSHATTVHGDCKITVQFSHGFFFPKSRYSENA